ncbi:MAG: hypothetical protein COV43_01350 [Deltaproteobacteria bacterium CG11_big_fil_rev_8_21_14_0_20_42_23]|nr:MAG: hypothetical protein COV43_01350 [Deltaproteobacteria bacterium CG11_big_fil_rev_8_21_14_0_20_42_23]PJC63312.1 MAG: hypothetical protein CO021_10175 [Deltaproteobacteria bacterium CG_4_9_14_0_2_um_filter_42_21]
MIIGLTGKNGAGKGAVAEILQSLGFEYHSLSDTLRTEIKNRGLEISRDNLTRIGTELRTQHGPGVLALKMLEQLPLNKNTIVDSVRNPFEVEALRRRKDFVLLSIEAESSIRFERIKMRARESDPVTYEAFVQQDAKEAQSKDPNAQQLNKTHKMADASIKNEGDVDELKHKVKEILQTLQAQLEANTLSEG